MSQAEDLLNSLTTDGEVEEHIVIGNDRFITVPQSLKKIAVQYDNNVRTVTFDCPRYSDGRDLSTMNILVNYMRPDGKPGQYSADNVTIDEIDNTVIHFDWEIREHVTRVNGTLSFLVCAKKTNSDGTNKNHWNSELNQDMTISKGLNCSGAIVEDYPDLIAQILIRLDNVEESDSISVKRRELAIEDVNEYTTTGYAKTEYGLTQNLPDQVYGYDYSFSSELGIIFFIAENITRKTGTQIFYPIDGPYKGRSFVRSLTNMNSDLPEPGQWMLLANEDEVNAAKEEANAYTDQNVGALLRYVQSIIRPYELTWTDGYYISKDDGSVQSEEGSSCCDFVYVTPGSKLVVSNTMTQDIEYNVFYDSSKNYISSFSTDNGSVVTVPENARYFRLSKHVPDSVIVLPEVFINTPKASTIELPIDGWTGSNLLYQQTVSVPIVTENSQVDLRPSPAQLEELLTSEISLTVANESGVITVFAIGGKPISDYTMQIIVSEVISV